MYESFRLQQYPEGLLIPYETLGEHFGSCVGSCHGGKTAIVVQDFLDRSGLSFDDAQIMARENLRRRTVQPLAQDESGLWVASWPDALHPSRLVLPDFILDHDIKGDCIAMPLTPDRLVVAGSQDDDALRKMAELAEGTLETPDAIAAIALRFDGATWSPWLPEKGHPLHDRFKRLLIMTVGYIYADQRTVLNARPDRDFFVANMMCYIHDTGQVTSYIVWSNVGRMYLPRAEQIGFVRMSPDRSLVAIIANGSWEQVTRVVGDTMRRVDGLHPERYLVEELPSVEELNQICPNGPHLEPGQSILITDRAGAHMYRSAGQKLDGYTEDGYVLRKPGYSVSFRWGCKTLRLWPRWGQGAGAW